MRKRFVFIAAAVITVAASASTDVTIWTGGLPAIVVPADSPAQFDTSDKADSAATFRGTFVLNGTYHITNTPPFETEDMSGGGIGIHFTPDAADLAKLPYWQSDIRADTIYFDNPTDILAALPPTGDLTNPNTDKAWTVSGHITIKVTGYSMHMECGGTYYTAHFVSLVGTPQKIARSAGTEDEHC